MQISFDRIPFLLAVVVKVVVKDVVIPWVPFDCGGYKDKNQLFMCALPRDLSQEHAQAEALSYSVTSRLLCRKQTVRTVQRCMLA